MVVRLKDLQTGEKKKSGLVRLSDLTPSTEVEKPKEFITPYAKTVQALKQPVKEVKKPTRLEVPKTSITKVKEQAEQFKKMGESSTRSAMAAQAAEKAAAPTYRERVGERLEKITPILRPLAAVPASISEIPFSRAMRQITMPEKETGPKVTGPAALAAELALPFAVPGAALGGGALYQRAGQALGRFAPKLAQTLVPAAEQTLGKRIASEAIKGAATGGLLAPASRLAFDPEASGRELAESAAFGAGGGALLGAAAPLFQKGITRLADLRKPSVSEPAPVTPTQGLIDRIRERPTTPKPITEDITPPLENPNELAKWVRENGGFDDVSLNEMRRLPYEDLRQLADEIVTSRSPRPSVSAAPPTRAPKQPSGTAKPLYNVGDEAIPTSADGTELSGATKIIDIQSKDGVNYYRFDGSNTYMPENQVKVSQAVPEAPRATQPARTTAGAKRGRTPQERGFIQTLEQSGKLTPEVAETLAQSTQRNYPPITNAETLARANRLIARDADKAEAQLLSRKKFTADDVAVGMRLIDDLGRSGNNERAVTIAEKISEKLTEAGQTVQAASMFNRLTPEGALIRATRVAKEADRTLDPTDAGQVINLAQAIQRSGQSIERSQNVMDIAAKLKRKETLNETELQELTNFVEDAKSMLGSSKKVKQTKVPRLPSDKKVRENLLKTLDDKEIALKDFIRKNSGRVSSTPLDLWGAYASLGAIKLAKGTVSFSKWSEDMIRDIGDGIRPHLSNLFDRAQQEASQLQRMLPDRTAAQKAAQKYIDAGKLNQKDAKLVHDLATRIGKMNTNDKQAASREMQSILNKYEKSSIEDKINALRYMAMLGNTMTQLTNMISSPIMLLERFLLDMIQTPFDIARASITGGPRRITFKQGPKVWDNFLTPLVDYAEGAKIGAEAGWKGVDPNGITAQYDVGGLAFKSKWSPARWAEGSLGAVMKGADYGSYNVAVKTRLRQMSYLDALNKGIKGNDNIKAYMDRYLNNVDDNIVELADKYGKEITFQTRSKAAMGAQKFVRGLNIVSTLGASDKIGLGSALMPFVRTPTNLLIAGLERTPLGLLKGLHELSTMSKNPNITSRQISETITKSLVGTLGLTGTGYVLGELGIVTGDSPSKSKDIQALEQDVGRGKFKFNTSAFSRLMSALISGNLKDIEEVSRYKPGDKQLNYNRLQPFSFPFSAGATFAEQQRQAGLAEKRGEEIPLSTQIGKSVVAAGQSLFDMSLLRGLKDAFDVHPGEGVGAIAKRIGQSYAKSFSPSLSGQEARRQDEAQRAVTYEGLIEPVKQYFQSRTPEQSQKLPPRVTTMGVIKRNEPGFIANYLNPLQSAETQYNEASKIIYDLIQRTGDEKLAPTPMDRTISGKKNGVQTKVKLTPQQYADLQQEVGTEISKRILKMPIGLRDEAAAKRIEKIYSAVREMERKELKRELGLR